jgi:DNA polymerase I-like protein with 3'-5' exonuclease and polymerase domains
MGINGEEFLPRHLLDLDPDIYMSNNFVVLDLETTIKDGTPDARNPNNSIVTATWVCGLEEEEHFVRGNEYDMGGLVTAISNADFFVAHNSKFEYKWLKRCGLDLYPHLAYCTQIGEYVYLSNRVKTGDLKLGSLAKRYLGEAKEPYVDLCMGGGVCPSELPESLLENRNRMDVHQTRKIFLQQRELLKRNNLLPTAFTRNILTPALADIENRGCHLGKARVDEEFNKESQALAEVEQEMLTLLQGYSPTSPKQMSEFIYDVLKFKPLKKGRGKNATEIRSTSKDVLDKLQPTNAKQRLFLELKRRHSEHNAAVTKNLRFFKSVVDNTEDSVFFFKFNQTVTRTQRLSSSGVKMAGIEGSIQGQNIPRKYKKLQVARKEGWKVVEIDGAQLEFRVGGHLGRDVTAIQAIVDGFDVHKFTASVLNKCDLNQVTKAMRTSAKMDTFKPLYGGTMGSKAQQEYYEAFRLRYTGITNTQLRWQDLAIRDKYITSETGLRFYYPDARLLPSGYCPAFPSICNYQVQSLATADIIPIAIVYMWHAMRNMEAFLTNTVHDSIIAESPDEELDELLEIGEWAFLTKVYEYLKKVYDIEFVAPLGIGFTAGYGWSEGEEIERAVAPPYRLAGVDYSALETSTEK